MARLRPRFPCRPEVIHLPSVDNARRASGDNVARAGLRANLLQSTGASHAPVYHCAFSQLQQTSVTTQQTPANSRKSLTLLQLLGLIGAAGLIASIALNLLVQAR